jgi:pimeloyl-ACP methyl ester carboxylesterase
MGATAVRPVFVPGLGLDARSSARLRARIAGTVVHLPGMGLRETVPEFSALVDRLVGGLGEGPVLLVGHSQSCQVVVAAAQRDPRVVGVVLLGPTTDPRLRRFGVLLRWWLATAVREPLWQMPLVVAQWARTGPRAMAALWRTAAPDRIDVRLTSVRVPVVVARGTRDALCPHDWAVRLAAAAPEGRLVEIPGAGHMTVQTHPDEVAAILRRYWPSVLPRTSA